MTGARARHCVVNVTVLALRLMGNVEVTLADKCVIFAISQFHCPSVVASEDFSSDETQKNVCVLCFLPSFLLPKPPANIH